MLTSNQKKEYSEQGYVVIRNVIDLSLVQKCLTSYEIMRRKCENYEYLFYRKFSDIAINDIYGIEHIFHPEIFEENIFQSIMESQILEISQELLNDSEVFLSRNRLHCTKNISHSGFWHRDGTPTGTSEDIDKYIKSNNNFHVQATLPYYKESGFYIVPGSHLFKEDYIPTKEIMGTKKILPNETKLTIYQGDLVVFNPLIIHRGTCVGRKKKQRSHIHLRFTKASNSKFAERYKMDSQFFKNNKVYNFANENWKKSFDLKLDDPVCWYGEEIVQKKFNFINIKSIFKIGLIAYNKILYHFSRFLPISQRNLENFKLIKYPYLKDEK